MEPEDLLNLQKHRWDNHEDPVVKMKRKEVQARALLASHGRPVNASNLFVVLMSTSYIAGLPQHSQRVTKNEKLLAVPFAQATQPELPYSLPKVPTQCACADLSALKAEKIYLSGSVREGTQVRLWSETDSDIDAMFQLGPATVLHPSDQNPAPHSQGRSVGLQFQMETTPNLGYLLLKHPRRVGCRHRDELVFGADRAVSLLDGFRARLDTDGASRREGPALSTNVADFIQHWRNTDLVPCLTAAGCWPGRAFASRARRSGQPSLQLARKLSQLPAFLVPVGFPGSATEKDEWRVSFSQLEYVLLRSMCEAQRECLTLLKTCKAILGLKALKSYHLKTALMWLCEKRPRDQWTREGTQESAYIIIFFLEEALATGNLACYFWPEVNILATRSAQQRSEISRDLHQLKARLLSCSLALVTHWLCGEVSHVADRLLFSDVPVSPTDRVAEGLLLDNFMRSLQQRGQADGWGFIHSLLTSITDPVVLPMPFGACYSLWFRSLRIALTSLPSSGTGWQELLGLLLALLRTLQHEQEPEAHQQEDSWMITP